MLPFLRFAVVACLLATLLSTLRVYPHQLAYFNELSGGPENGYRHMQGSALDYGQSYLELCRWAESRGLTGEALDFRFARMNHLQPIWESSAAEGGAPAPFVAVTVDTLARREADGGAEAARVKSNGTLIGFTHWVIPRDCWGALREGR